MNPRKRLLSQPRRTRVRLPDELTPESVLVSVAWGVVLAFMVGFALYELGWFR